PFGRRIPAARQRRRRHSLSLGSLQPARRHLRFGRARWLCRRPFGFHLRTPLLIGLLCPAGYKDASAIRNNSRHANIDTWLFIRFAAAAASPHRPKVGSGWTYILSGSRRVGGVRATSQRTARAHR